MHFFIGHESAVDVEFSPFIESESAESGDVECMLIKRLQSSPAVAFYAEK
jgi:hypothetical protein